MIIRSIICGALLAIVSLNSQASALETKLANQLTLAEANKLVTLPLHCVETPYPYKTGLVLASPADLQQPSVHHPIFYGCFDWHSAAHGYWSLVTLLSQFPNLAQADEVKTILQRNLTKQKVAAEVAFFSKDINASFERL